MLKKIRETALPQSLSIKTWALATTSITTLLSHLAPRFGQRKLKVNKLRRTLWSRCQISRASTQIYPKSLNNKRRIRRRNLAAMTSDQTSHHQTTLAPTAASWRRNCTRSASKTSPFAMIVTSFGSRTRRLTTKSSNSRASAMRKHRPVYWITSSTRTWICFARRRSSCWRTRNRR